MWSVFRSEVDKQFWRNAYVPVGRLCEKSFPVPLRYRIIAAPLSSPFFGHTQISRQLSPSPCFNYVREILHSDHCGAMPHSCQGVKPQCFIWLNP